MFCDTKWIWTIKSGENYRSRWTNDVVGLNCLTTSHTTSQAIEVVTDIAQKQKEGRKEREKDSGILRIIKRAHRWNDDDRKGVNKKGERWKQ